jgi:uncharacterized protein (TIGR02996 family)
VSAELFAAVYADPEDDSPRHVLGDYLLDHGDPRGELIQLQLARSRDGFATSRELELLELHAERWLGPLAKAVRFGESCRTRFERGFLAEADLVPNSRKLLLPIAADPAWATVEIFTHDVPAQLLDRTPLTALRRISINTGRFRRLARRAIAFGGVAHVDVRSPIELDKLVRVFPRLRSATFHYYPAVDTLGVLAAIGVRELVFEGHEPHYDNEHGEFVDDLTAERSPFERVSVRSPWGYPELGPWGDYRRATTGFLVRVER